MRGRGAPGLHTRPAVEQRGELLHAAPAACDVEHGADERAVHVAQELVRLDPELEHLAVLAPPTRGLPWSSAVNSFSLRLPPATSSMVPTSARFMWRSVEEFTALL